MNEYCKHVQGVCQQKEQKEGIVLKHTVHTKGSRDMN